MSAKGNPTPNDRQIIAAARAIMNERGARAGMPEIANIEDMLAPEQWSQALDEARAALKAAAEAR